MTNWDIFIALLQAFGIGLWFVLVIMYPTIWKIEAVVWRYKKWRKDREE